MALHQKSEFCALTGIKTKHFTTYLDRGKILMREDGMVDDAEPVNAEFIAMMRAKGKTAQDAPKPSKKGKKAPEKQEKAPINPESAVLLELEKKKKTADIERSEQDKFLKSLQIQKIQGKLIPTDLVRVVITSLSKQTHTGFKQAIDLLLTEIAAKHKLNGNQLAEWRGRAVAILNDAINKNVEASKREVENIVSEYSFSKNAA